MTRRKTDEEFKQEVFSLVGDEFKFLELYQGAFTKIKVKHSKCGNVYKVTPHDFLRGKRCPYCAGHIKKTDTQFKQEIFSIVGDEYTFLDKYVNNVTKLRVKHNKCGNTYGVFPCNFLRGSRCPYCARLAKHELKK